MTNRNQDWNSRVIEEFRSNGGTVGGQFEGRTLALVHHVGRRSGEERINPLACLRVGESFAVFGSAAGRDRHPDWYHNVMAQPDIVTCCRSTAGLTGLTVTQMIINVVPVALGLLAT